MAFYSQGKEFLNLPEQVQKNIDDISDLQTSVATKQDSSTAVNDTNLKEKVEAVGSYDLGAVSVTNLTNTGNTTNTGTLDQEGKATFGSDVEVDGSATFNSPESLVFKTGSLDFSELTNFISTYYNNAYKMRFSGITLYSYESGTTYFSVDALFTDFKANVTNCSLMMFATTSETPEIRLSFSGQTVGFARAFERLTFTTENRQVTIDNVVFSGASSLCEASNLKVFVATDTKALFTMSRAFYGCSSLEEVGTIDVSSITATGGLASMFYGCTSLKSVHMTHFKVSFDISASTQFEESDLVEIIGNLDTVTTAQTLTMGSTNLAKLTQDEILVATGKGWTLA